MSMGHGACPRRPSLILILTGVCSTWHTPSSLNPARPIPMRRIASKHEGGGAFEMLAALIWGGADGAADLDASAIPEMRIATFSSSATLSESSGARSDTSLMRTSEPAKPQHRRARHRRCCCERR